MPLPLEVSILLLILQWEQNQEGAAPGYGGAGRGQLPHCLYQAFYTQGFLLNPAAIALGLTDCANRKLGCFAVAVSLTVSPSLWVSLVSNLCYLYFEPKYNYFHLSSDFV